MNATPTRNQYRSINTATQSSASGRGGISSALFSRTVDCHLLRSVLVLGSAAVFLLGWSNQVCLGFTGNDDPVVTFNRDVRPILSDKCFHCHGPDEESREADLRFDLKDSAFLAIEPGSLEDSPLIHRILDEDPDSRMPPADTNKPLTENEIQILKKWIEQGAPWAEHWAYSIPRKHGLPQVATDATYDNWIDRFVTARLEQQSIELAPPADKTTLLRRLYFDLIGLPPTPAQVQSFLADESPQAYETVVDELLASPHFGERLAIYWLDLVRFADTVGYHGDQPHNISPYRDWVIDAFNRNLPFDQFTREQLAGDLLPNPTEAQKIASGYNRLLQTTHEGGLQPKEYSAIYAADRVRNVSLVWMGATVGCAQCHDHKYDPYTSKDFYSLAAFFADIDDEKHFKVGTNAVPTRRPPEILVISEENRAELEKSQSRINDQKDKIAKLKSTIKKSKAQIESPDHPEPSPGAVDGTKLQAELSRRNSELETLESELKVLEQQRAEIESRGQWTMITQPLEKPRVTRVLARGNWMDESGEVVQPAVPAFLGEIETASKLATRLDLANWLTDANQGAGRLTARVFANRFWYLLMGVGVSKSLDDFGGQGEAPAHPELLDNLAIEFIDSGWDIKHMFRQIVTSKTYRQSSIETPEVRKLDPYNQLFSHQSRYRLPAELIRDNALAISGLLNDSTIGGKSVKPFQPANYYQHLNFPPRKYQQDQDEQQWRRGVYVHWQRMFLHPSLKAFDAPSREECTAQRPKSNTPSAALVLLNDPIFVEAARVFAERILKESASDSFEDRLETAFMLAVSRIPDPDEVRILSDLFQSSLQEFKQSPDSAAKLLSVGQFAAEPSAESPARLAAWTTIARAILNMNETITRN